ncbi:MAG: YbhB/YbcL family Raf kinase inhibitor-like protein [Pseudomonadota bacterium]
MKQELTVDIKGWANGAPIPEKFAFGRIPAEGRFETGGNVSPGITWSNVPEGTNSFAIICHDPDVPSVGDDVNQEGKVVASDLPRVDFFHWVLANIPASVRGLDEGIASMGVTPKGKTTGQKNHGDAGLNNYTDWFSGDPDMEGIYGDYDGPCPPWNDLRVHRYIFTVYALGAEALSLPDKFSGQDLLGAMEGQILASGSFVGTYSMNPDVAG